MFCCVRIAAEWISPKLVFVCVCVCSQQVPVPASAPLGSDSPAPLTWLTTPTRTTTTPSATPTSGVNTVSWPGSCVPLAPSLTLSPHDAKPTTPASLSSLPSSATTSGVLSPAPSGIKVIKDQLKVIEKIMIMMKMLVVITDDAWCAQLSSLSSKRVYGAGKGTACGQLRLAQPFWKTKLQVLERVILLKRDRYSNDCLLHHQPSALVTCLPFRTEAHGHVIND